MAGLMLCDGQSDLAARESSTAVDPSLAVVHVPQRIVHLVSSSLHEGWCLRWSVPAGLLQGWHWPGWNVRRAFAAVKVHSAMSLLPGMVGWLLVQSQG